MQLPLACVLSQFLRQHRVPVSARLAVALSGGPDSLALAILLSDYHKQIHGDGAHVHEPLALVVDHALRADSAREASTAAEQARGLGLSPRVLALTWPQGRPSGGRLLAEAREARYRALTGACRAEGCAGLLLGHHAGDQMETFLIRLSHATGLKGLSGMQPVSSTTAPLPLLLRPLLARRKAELAALCLERGLEPCQDPSNANLDTQRARWRRALAGASPEVEPALRRMLSRCAGLRVELEAAEDCLLGECLLAAGRGVPLPRGGISTTEAQTWADLAELPSAVLDMARLRRAPAAAARGALARVLRAVGGKRFVDDAEAGALLVRLQGANAATGGGCFARVVGLTRRRCAAFAPLGRQKDLESGLRRRKARLRHSLQPA